MLFRDGHWTLVAALHEHGPRPGVCEHRVVARIDALPFRNDAFGAAATSGALECVPDDRQAVAELARVITPAGQVRIAVANRGDLGLTRRRLRDRVAGRRRPAGAYVHAANHVREYTEAEIRSLLGPLFEIGDCAAVAWGTGRRREPVNRLLVRLPGTRRYLEAIVVEATRRAGRSSDMARLGSPRDGRCS
jgi:SAM-dependent methyltransferase